MTINDKTSPLTLCMPVINATILWLCFTVAAILPLAAMAENKTNKAISTKGEKHTDSNNLDTERPIEAGPGGNIKLENNYRTKAESMFEWHAHTPWESHYVTEGRDNLSGKQITSISSEVEVSGLSIVPWIADSPDSRYTEFNLNILSTALN